MEKANFTENTLIYLNKRYLTVKKNKKIFYCDYFLLAQIVEASNPPQEVSSFTLKEGKLKTARPWYNDETGEFLALYETFGYMVVRGSPEEVFVNYGFDKENSKVLYSHYMRTIPNAFYGTMFNRHDVMVKSGEVDSDRSGYLFLFAVHNGQI